MKENNSNKEFSLDNEDLKKNPFSIDPNYMDQLNVELIALKQVDPELNLPKAQSFQVEPNYFSTLDLKLKGISNANTSQSKYWIIAIAASLALLIGLVNIDGQGRSNSVSISQADLIKPDKNVIVNFDSYQKETLIAYAESHYIDDMNVEEISEIVETTNSTFDENLDAILEADQLAQADLIPLNEEIQTEDIEDYLEENYDLDELIEVY